MRYSSATLSLVNGSETPSGAYRFTRDLSGRSLWVRVEGGDLPMPVEILVDRTPEGRYMFTGLRLGGDPEEDEYEITSQTLRQIRLSEIQAAYFEHFEPIRLMEESLAEVSYPLRPRGPEHEALSAFARTYLTELARQPRRAMTAAAKTHNISRATANRWAATCRELGMLPSASSGEELPS